MKVKAKSKIPSSDYYKGLSTEDWNKLNAGEEVEITDVPESVKPYLNLPEQKKKDK